jgi:DNA-binding NarL/FixJ family response regulator
MRESVVRALDEFPQVDVFEFYSYPPKRGYLRDVLENSFNVVMIELDSAPETALGLIEEATDCSGAAILVYSEKTDVALALRCMKAGASEYLYLPPDPAALSNQIRTALASYPITSTNETIHSGAYELNCAIPEVDRQNFLSLIPETLPANFCDWDAESGPERQDGTPAGLETAHVLLAEPAEQSIEREAIVPPCWDWSQIAAVEGEDPGENTSGTISPSFTSRTTHESDVVIERPLAEFQFGDNIPGKRCRELGAARTQEADEELRELFRSSVENSQPKTLKKRKRIAAPIVIGIILPLMTVTVGMMIPRVDSGAKQLVLLCANSIRVQLNSDTRNSTFVDSGKSGQVR